MEVELICNWNDLAEYLEKGLRIITVEQGPGTGTTIKANAPAAVIQMMEDRMAERKGTNGNGDASQSRVSRKRSRNMLDQVMRELVTAAKAAASQAQRVELKRGLGIDVMVGHDGRCHLQLWRKDNYPGAREWGIVLAGWPGAPSDVAYRQFEKNARYYLRGEWDVKDETGGLNE